MKPDEHVCRIRVQHVHWKYLVQIVNPPIDVTLRDVASVPKLARLPVVDDLAIPVPVNIHDHMSETFPTVLQTSLAP